MPLCRCLRPYFKCLPLPLQPDHFTSHGYSPAWEQTHIGRSFLEHGTSLPTSVHACADSVLYSLWQISKACAGTFPPPQYSLILRSHLECMNLTTATVIKVTANYYCSLVGSVRETPPKCLQRNSKAKSCH